MDERLVGAHGSRDGSVPVVADAVGRNPATVVVSDTVGAPAQRVRACGEAPVPPAPMKATSVSD